MKSYVVVSFQFAGRSHIGRSKNDAVFYSCPVCGDLVWLESVSGKEFARALGNDESLTCEQCYEGSISAVGRSQCFFFHYEIDTYVAEDRLAYVAAYLLRKLDETGEMPTYIPRAVIRPGSEKDGVEIKYRSVLE